MEKVRQETEGGTGSTAKRAQSPVVMLPARQQKLRSGEFFAGEFKLDEALMSGADHTQDIVKEADKAVDAIRSKKASLVTKESKMDKAARFFATHGMDRVAHMLGAKYSAATEEGAMAEQKVALTKLKAAIPAPSFPKASDAEDLDTPDDDEDEVKERQHWAAVDALRKRKAAVLTQASESFEKKDLDIDEVIHEDEVEEEQRWAAVDALRKRKVQIPAI